MGGGGGHKWIRCHAKLLLVPVMEARQVPGGQLLAPTWPLMVDSPARSHQELTESIKNNITKNQSRKHTHGELKVKTSTEHRLTYQTQARGKLTPLRMQL